ncbi:MAG: type II secretion system F family protein [Planctomycetes bacterium]|nr:type II secretion system F family protein [Planctomycetota bacterium]
MASFRYKAVDESGAVVTGVILADTPADVRRELRGMRLFPERVALSKAASPALADLLPSARGRARQHVAIFTRQCSVLLASGVPIVEALDVLARQAEHRRLSEVLLEVRESVSAGYSFADALSRYPQFFDQAYIEMVASGQKSGMMDVVFSRLADFLEQRRLLRAKVSTALIYPSILVVMALGLLIFLSAVVVPMLEPLLAQHKGALPLSTHLLFALCDFVRRYVWTLAPIVLGALIALGWLRRSRGGRRLLDAVLLGLPLAGNLMRKSLVSRFSMSFAILLRTGVPALEALETLAALTPNAALAAEVADIQQAVAEGKDISERMRGSRLFPPMVSYMIAIGERSGNMAEALEHVSKSYDLEVDIASRRMLTVLEPILILVIAAGVGFIAVSLMVTILGLSNI